MVCPKWAESSKVLADVSCSWFAINIVIVLLTGR